MSETLVLSVASIEKLQNEYGYDDHFTSIVLPRLIFLNKIKELFSEKLKLDWTVYYSPVNRSENSINISLIDPGKKYHLFYSVPLMQKFELRLHLNDDTFNFLSLRKVLVEKEVIKEDEFRVGATKNTLPYLILNNPSVRFSRALLDNEQTDKEKLKASAVYQAMEASFKRFNKSLYNIIFGSW